MSSLKDGVDGGGELGGGIGGVDYVRHDDNSVHAINASRRATRSRSQSPALQQSQIELAEAQKKYYEQKAKNEKKAGKVTSKRVVVMRYRL